MSRSRGGLFAGLAALIVATIVTRAAALHDDDPGGHDVLPGDDRQIPDPAADLDLFVFRCSDPSCTTRTEVGRSADRDSEESVTLTNPVAATYQVDVDGFAAPAGETTYDYVDVFANPGLGSVSVTDSDAQRNQGSTWTVPGSVLVSQVPEAGRVMLGNVRVVTTAGVQVGSGDVVVEHVTP